MIKKEEEDEELLQSIEIIENNYKEKKKDITVFEAIEPIETKELDNEAEKDFEQDKDVKEQEMHQDKLGKKNKTKLPKTKKTKISGNLKN